MTSNFARCFAEHFKNSLARETDVREHSRAELIVSTCAHWSTKISVILYSDELFYTQCGYVDFARVLADYES